MKQWITVVAASLAAILMAGCGVGHNAPTTSTAWRTVRLGGLSLRLPHTWRLSKQLTLSRESASGGMALFPGDAYDNPGPVHLAHPYLSKRETTYGRQRFFNLFETSGGSWYTLGITVPEHQSALLHRVIGTLKLPRPATATALVHQFIAHHPALQARASVASPVSYVRAIVGHSQWLLVQGEAATVMQPFALFHSTTAGRHWSLINDSNLHGGLSDFPDDVGQVTMLFLTPHDGIFVEATAVGGGGLLVYRTTNAGYSWHLQRLAPPASQIIGNLHLTNSHGTLEVSVALTAGRVFHAESTNGGRTWRSL